MNSPAFGPACLAILVALFSSFAVQAEPLSVADRINQAESRATALKAQNQQLQQTVESQAAALRRLDQMTLEAQTKLQAERDRATSLKQALAETQLQLEQSRSSGQKALANRDAKLQACIVASESGAATLNTMNSTIMELRQQLALHSASSNRLQQYEADLASCQRKNAAQTAELQARASQLTALQGENAQLGRKLAQQQSSNRERDNVLAAQSEALQVELRRARGIQEQKQADIDRMQSQLAHLMERNRSLQQQLANSSSLEEVGALQRQLNQLSNSNQILQQQLADARSPQEFDALQTQLDELSAAHQQAIQTCQKQLKDSTPNSEIRALQSQNLRMKKDYDEALLALQNCDALYAEAQQQAVRPDRAAAGRECEDKLTRVQTEADQAKAGLIKANEQIRNLQQRSAQAVPSTSEKEELSRLRLALEQARAQIRQANQELETQRATTTSSASQATELARLQSELSHAQAKLREASANLESELRTERAMHALAEADLEAALGSEIKDLQSALRACQAR